MLTSHTAICDCSQNKLTKCQFGHSELTIPTESAIKELYYDISFKTVHYVFIMYLAYIPVKHTYRVTSGLLTRPNLTQVKYNTQYADYANVKHINIMRKLLHSKLLLYKREKTVRRCWYH